MIRITPRLHQITPGLKCCYGRSKLLSERGSHGEGWRGARVMFEMSQEMELMMWRGSGIMREGWREWQRETEIEGKTEKGMGLVESSGRDEWRRVEVLVALWKRKYFVP